MSNFHIQTTILFPGHQQSRSADAKFGDGIWWRGHGWLLFSWCIELCFITFLLTSLCHLTRIVHSRKSPYVRHWRLNRFVILRNLKQRPRVLRWGRFRAVLVIVHLQHKIFVEWRAWCEGVIVQFNSWSNLISGRYQGRASKVHCILTTTTLQKHKSYGYYPTKSITGQFSRKLYINTTFYYYDRKKEESEEK